LTRCPLLPSATCGSRHYLNRGTVVDTRVVPLGTRDDVTIYRDRDATAVDVETLKQLRHALFGKRFGLTIDSDHERPSMKCNASSAAKGASVTPWR
jgi:hypothetical protein